MQGRPCSTLMSNQIHTQTHTHCLQVFRCVIETVLTMLQTFNGTISWLYVIIMSWLYVSMYNFQSESTLYSCLNIKELLAWNRHHIWSLSDSNRIRTHNHLVRKWILNHLAKLAKLLSSFWVLICIVHLIVCYCHVIYKFQIESTLCSCLNVKELLAQTRCHTWS